MADRTARDEALHLADGHAAGGGELEGQSAELDELFEVSHEIFL
jgi:hypothetical protein